MANWLPNPFKSTNTKNNEEQLQDELSKLGLTKDNVAYIMQQGEKFLEKPDILAKKLKIEPHQALKAMNQLKAYMNQKISRGIKEFAKLVKEHPEDTPEDIALLHDIPEDVVTAYLAYSEEKPLTQKQKITIKEKYNAGFSMREIADQLQVSEMKIKDHVEKNFLTFGGEGKKILDIIYKHFEEYPMAKLRQMIITKNIKLQEQICCELPKNNDEEYNDLKRYFMKFEESKNFFIIESTLSIEAKASIRSSSMDNIGELSSRLNLMKVVIRDYLLQYYPDKSLMLHFEQEQSKMPKLESDFRLDTLISHTTYRMIISDSFKNLIKGAQGLEMSPKKILEKLLPLAFYYIKCSLPLEEFTQIIATITNIPLTTLDVFHLIFQMSDPVVRGLCIEHYSFSNPVPFYYPKLEPKMKKSRRFEICKELWYSVQQFNGLVSFGLGWASWNPIGKSHLLDLMFETDFVKGSPQNSAFHFNSIDVQMTKNLFGEKEKTSNESTQWAYIDCHGCPDSNVIGCICQNLDIALIHVSHSDFRENRNFLEHDLNTMETKYVYVLVRDYKGENRDTKKLPLSSDKTYTVFFIPNLNQHNIQLLSVLKDIGHQILHSSVGNTRLIGSNFLEKLIMENDKAETLKEEKGLIDKICSHICTNRSELHYSFLSYYPHFVEYMRYYYEATNETDQKKIDQLNLKREELAKQLNGAKMNDIVFQFNKILSMKNSSLILWKLSQELKILSVDMGKTKTEKYTLEILWREALLSNKYNFKQNPAPDSFAKGFSSNFSNHVARGEPFELIDGDNLRFFNQEIDALLFDFYEKQSQQIITINKNKKRPPIVISIFGPQSSGKSTLLNYCFGCKFLTSAGRCTKGVYGSLSKLSEPINNSDHFLILDTEGLDAIEKAQTLQDTSCIHFDRTMVLFCLAVSQVIIINVKGDIGEEMRNLLQICAYSLNKLKVSKVTAPKIFFVLNQQADPDPEKHLNSINTLLEKLTKESYLMDEGIVISDIIQVSRNNLFVLPSAFNSKCVNTEMANLFDSDQFKLSPTVSFANKCTNLRMSIIHELKKVRPDDEAPFTTVSEWMEMSGVIWDTIVKYQDIVKYRNVEELKCSITLRVIVSDTLKHKIYQNKEQYQDVTEKLIVRIKNITKWSPSKVVLEDVKQELDEVFEKYQQEALTDFEAKCKDDFLLRKLNYMCEEAKKDLKRLIYMEKKICEDKLKFEIKARLVEIKLSENMKKFQEAIEKNADEYFELDIEQQKSAFEKVWAKCFVNEKIEEEDDEWNDILDDLYSKFRMESKTMENIHTIYPSFSTSNFNINMIPILHNEMLSQFSKEPDKVSEAEQFIYPWKENKVPLKEMTPYTGKVQCEYLSKDTLWSSTEVYSRERGRAPIPKLNFREWVPPDCYSLVQYCSGYYNHPDIVWNPARRKQILLLASQLRNPNCIEKSTWEKLINDISIQVQEFIKKDPNISHSTVKEIVNHLCHICKVVNYEINYIEAKLTNAAERKISTFAFAITFKSLLETRREKQRKDKSDENENKEKNCEYFLQKVENRKIARGNWNRKEMREGDRKIANKFADDLLAAIWRSIKTTCEQNINEEYFNAKREAFSHKSILHLANRKISEELEHYGCKRITEDNFVIQYICNRTESLKMLFREEWLKVAKEFQPRIVGKMKRKFEEQLTTIKCVLTDLLAGLVAECSKLNRREEIGLDSDSNFVVAGGEKSTEESACNSYFKTKEAPFKAMVLFLKMYFDPQVSSDKFNKFFSNIFEIDGVNMKKNPETYVLFEKPLNQPNVLDRELFKRLSDTNMLRSTETIFNIKFYVEQFLGTLNRYELKVTQAQYEKILKTTKDNFETRVINCPYRCPSCGKFCEKEIHPHGEKCQILTGHQICSMGGNVWKDQDRTAILLMCEDYKDDTKVLIPGQNMKWGEFKEKSGNEWDWSLPTDPNFTTFQDENRKKTIKIWNKFGQEILEYYAKKGTPIKYIPYTTTREICESLFTPNYYVCFVVDGTELMCNSIKYVKKWVLTLMKDSEGITYFKVIVYHGHGSQGTCVEKFPDNSEFTSDVGSIENFIENISTYSGEEEQLAMLDGLATAIKKSDWKTDYGVWNSIVHFYVEPTQGYFEVFKAIGECKHGCPFDWERDINDRRRKLNIKYTRKMLINSTHPDYDDVDVTRRVNDETTSGIDLNAGKESANKSGVFINYKTND